MPVDIEEAKIKIPKEILAIKYFMCSTAIEGAIKAGKEVRLKDITRTTRGKIPYKDAVAVKYFMCSKEADELIKKKESVAVKYFMCSKEAEDLIR